MSDENRCDRGPEESQSGSSSSSEGSWVMVELPGGGRQPLLVATGMHGEAAVVAAPVGGEAEGMVRDMWRRLKKKKKQNYLNSAPFSFCSQI